MDPKTAVLNYQYGEKAKSELILASKLITGLAGFSDVEKKGGKKMVLLMLDGIRSEIVFARESTHHASFQKAVEALNVAISMVEGEKPDEAVQKVAEAISAATTVAQESWEVLAAHGIL